MGSEGCGTWFVSVCLCVYAFTFILQLQASRLLMSVTNSFSTTSDLKNIVPDFAEMSEFESEKLARSQATLHGLTFN